MSKMQIYVAYFNNESEVVTLRFCDGYTHAEEIFQEICNDFVTFYAKEFKNGAVLPTKICRYTEGEISATFIPKLKADSTFKEGICFSRKKYEATVYEKLVLPGTVYNSYSVKYLGRISILSLTLDSKNSCDEYSLTILKDTILAKDRVISELEKKAIHQEYELQRLNAENSKLRKEIEDMVSQKTTEQYKNENISKIVTPSLEELQNKKADMYMVRKEIENLFGNSEDPMKVLGTYVPAKYKLKNGRKPNDLISFTKSQTCDDEIEIMLREIECLIK